MDISMKYDYGRCPCSGTFENRIMEVSMTVGGKEIVLTGIPQGFCSSCGSYVYKAEVLSRIESITNRERFDNAREGYL